MKKFFGFCFLFAFFAAFATACGPTGDQCGEEGLPSCAQGTVCSMYKSFKQCMPECAKDEDCPSGAGLKCAASSVESGKMACTDGSASTGCTSNSDCATGQECKSGKCETPSSGACSTDRDCATGQECKSGKCQAKTVVPTGCTKHSECSAGYLCGNDGKCTNACKAGDPCGTGYSCVNSVCTKDGQTTGCSPACGSGQTCQNGQCVNSGNSGCGIHATVSGTGVEVKLIELSNMAIDGIRCETAGFDWDGIEGASVSVANGVANCPANTAYIHLVRGSDWPKLPNTCTNNVGVELRDGNWSFEGGKSKPGSWVKIVR